MNTLCKINLNLVLYIQEGEIMNHIEFKNMTKTYPNGFTALKNISTTFHQNEFIVIVGPSGCGKTTLLRTIAGLEKITSGELFIHHTNMDQIPSNQRNVSMVFQNYPLFNHMTVYENILFGLKSKNYNKNVLNDEIHSLSKKLSIDSLLNQYPAQLSGGQKQRVSLARSLISKPDILLMDEPLSNLDISLKTQLRQLIKDLHQSLNTTFVYVTHDHQEALSLATRIIVLKDGIIMQDGTPEEIYQNPNNLFVADFMSQYPLNIFECELNESNQIYLNNYKIEIPLTYHSNKVIIGIRAENFNLETDQHFISAPITQVELNGSDYLVHAMINNQNCLIRTQSKPTSNEINVSLNQYFLFDPSTKSLICKNKKSKN